MQETDLVTTGMEIRTSEGQTVNTIVIRGDISCDGKVTATDLSQFKQHDTGLTKLTGARLQAADINFDGNVTVVDHTQLKMLIVGLPL